MRCSITIHFSIHLFLISYINYLSSSRLVEASTISDTQTELWQQSEKGHSSPHLSKRITSIFPNSGHGSTTFNVIHVIAAVIGIVGATLLMIVLVLYYKRKRRRLIAEAEAASETRNPYGLPPTPSSLSTASASFNNGCRSSLHPQSSIPGTLTPPNSHNHHRKPSNAMSQFQVFQSEYYYDDEKQNLQTEKLIQNVPCTSASSSSPYQFMPSPPPRCLVSQAYHQHHPCTSITNSSSPPPYKP